MTIVFKEIASLLEVDIDGLFEDSFPDIDVNFFNFTTATTHEEKKAFYFGQLQDAIKGTSYLQREGDRFFMFKASIDGTDCVFNGGFIETSGAYRGHWYLSRPINGSRSWITSTETSAARKDFFTSVGITSFKAGGDPSSMVLSNIRRNQNVTVVAEDPVANSDNIELTVQV